MWATAHAHVYTRQWLYVLGNEQLKRLLNLDFYYIGRCCHTKQLTSLTNIRLPIENEDRQPQHEHRPFVY